MRVSRMGRSACRPASCIRLPCRPTSTSWSTSGGRWRAGIGCSPSTCGTTAITSSMPWTKHSRSPVAVGAGSRSRTSPWPASGTGGRCRGHSNGSNAPARRASTWPSISIRTSRGARICRSSSRSGRRPAARPLSWPGWRAHPSAPPSSRTGAPACSSVGTRSRWHQPSPVSKRRWGSRWRRWATPGRWTRTSRRSTSSNEATTGSRWWPTAGQRRTSEPCSRMT